MGHFSSKREGPGKGAVAGRRFKSKLFQSFRDNREAPVSSAQISKVVFGAALCNLRGFLLPPHTLHAPPSSHSSGCYEQHLKISFPAASQDLSLLPGYRTGATLQEMHLHQETPIGIRHAVTPAFISALCFFVHFAFILHPQHYKEQGHRGRESIHEKCEKSKPSIPTNILYQALKIRADHKINTRTACQKAFSWVQAEPVHNRLVMQNLKAKKKGQACHFNLQSIFRLSSLKIISKI